MREVGMMFNRDMVLGLGRAARKAAFGKYETRRTFKLPKWSTMDWTDVEESTSREGGLQAICANTGCFSDIKPKVQPGDWIYAKETVRKEGDKFWYGADHISLAATVGKWTPSMLMPKAAARYWMRCTEVRAERLLDITEEGARREGLIHHPLADGWHWEANASVLAGSAVMAYLALFDNINGDGAAEANPWVWVYKWEEVEYRG